MCDSVCGVKCLPSKYPLYYRKSNSNILCACVCVCFPLATKSVLFGREEFWIHCILWFCYSQAATVTVEKSHLSHSTVPLKFMGKLANRSPHLNWHAKELTILVTTECCTQTFKQSGRSAKCYSIKMWRVPKVSLDTINTLVPSELSAGQTGQNRIVFWHFLQEILVS